MKVISKEEGLKARAKEIDKALDKKSQYLVKGIERDIAFNEKIGKLHERIDKIFEAIMKE